MINLTAYDSVEILTVRVKYSWILGISLEGQKDFMIELESKVNSVNQSLLYGYQFLLEANYTGPQVVV